MRAGRSLTFALFAAALLWIAAASATHADQPGPALPSAAPGAAPSGASPAPSASAGISNPFPSPSPSPVSAQRNGYVAAGYIGGTANGGNIPPTPGSTSTPGSFPSSGANGFWVDILGRLAPSFFAAVLYDNLSVHGGDNPLVSYAEGRLLYQPAQAGKVRAALGLGLISTGRSTSNANANGLGIGLDILPNFNLGLTPYGSVFFYPRLQSGGQSATLTAVDAGVMYGPRSLGGPFLRVGGYLRSGAPTNTSPTQVSGVAVGLGTSF